MRSGWPKAWQAAWRPCCIDVEAKRGKADDIAGRIDMGDRRLEMLVDDHTASRDPA